MTLYDTKSYLLKWARTLPKKYEDYDITELANKYCEAKDKKDSNNMNVYISALLLRFWYTIDKMYQKCRTIPVSREECFDKLYDCIETAMEYRAWQDPNKKTNAQACINQVIASRGAAALIYEANLHKNTPPAYSLDEPASDNTSVYTTKGDLLSDEDQYTWEDNFEVHNIIQFLINKNKVVEAMIADTIAYKDVYKATTKTIKETMPNGKVVSHKVQSSQFWPTKVVKELDKLTPDYVYYFSTKYLLKDADKHTLQSAFETINKATAQKKHKYIDNTLSFLRQTLIV